MSQSEPIVLVTPCAEGRLHYSEAAGFWTGVIPAGSSPSWLRVVCCGAALPGEVKLNDFLRILGVEAIYAQTSSGSTRDEACRALTKNWTLIKRFREKCSAEASMSFPASFTAPIPRGMCLEISNLADSMLRGYSHKEDGLREHLRKTGAFTIDLLLHSPYGGDTTAAAADARSEGRVVVGNYALPVFVQGEPSAADMPLVLTVLVPAIAGALADGASRLVHRQLLETHVGEAGAALLDPTYTMLVKTWGELPK